MYGNYGRREDLEVLQKSNIVLEGSVLLLRAGNISFAEQVCVDLTSFSYYVVDPISHFYKQMYSR